MQAASHRARFNQRGVSVIESLCTVAVVAAVSSLAMPSFEGLRTQRALDGIAAQVWIQLKAVVLTIVWSGVVSLVAYKIVDLTIGLRVPEDEEREGLDITSHGETAYSK